ncbi:putative TOM core complex subunit Tom6 [Daldinia decipiens]|uniref:putative TOM core complex subunit Tom6 n=1 Tax=Daldinia decipiens TaxID=326647 RepID=UPI0020C1CEA5|nr:putative TOM core complex subunit Tom6 [Daldinia decipiens]KAI1655513.1 putative TOM core complex subunit Tom6 [Daldinia decipiens]
MPPKRVGGRSNKGVVSTIYEAFTSPENASVVRSVAIFGAAVAFLASPWSEYLLPP